MISSFDRVRGYAFFLPRRIGFGGGYLRLRRGDFRPVFN